MATLPNDHPSLPNGADSVPPNPTSGNRAGHLGKLDASAPKARGIGHLSTRADELTELLASLRLLSPLHAGRKLGVSAARMVQLANAGEIRAITDSGGRRMFLEEDVDALLLKRIKDAAFAILARRQ